MKSSRKNMCYKYSTKYQSPKIYEGNIERIEGKRDSWTIIVGDSNILLSKIGRISRRKIILEMEDLKINNQDLTDI